jgi:hypothetical protein
MFFQKDSNGSTAVGFDEVVLRNREQHAPLDKPFLYLTSRLEFFLGMFSRVRCGHPITCRRKFEIELFGHMSCRCFDCGQSGGLRPPALAFAGIPADALASCPDVWQSRCNRKTRVASQRSPPKGGSPQRRSHRRVLQFSSGLPIQLTAKATTHMSAKSRLGWPSPGCGRWVGCWRTKRKK